MIILSTDNTISHQGEKLYAAVRNQELLSIQIDT